jgi:hypothetical protein
VEDFLLFEWPSLTASIWLPCYSFFVLGGGFVAFRAAVYDGQYLATWSSLAKDDASFPQHLKRNEDLI